ncbi:MAG: hypothetical protein ABL977_09010 [Candidatus Eisenbacteria bacterium]
MSHSQRSLPPARVRARIGALVFALLLTAALGSRAAAADCGCPPPADTTGVVWQGNRPLALHEIAALLAPVMSFSPDEPLLRRSAPIPAAHPCDTPADQAVVYYQINSMVIRDQAVTRPAESDPAFFDKVQYMRLRYFFYYPIDLGTHGHRHDVEGVGMEVLLEHDANGCRRVRLQRVLAFAHGLPLYNNRLRITDDTKLPITLMVEEGKHASCIDRNADGMFTPGYDVNERINDAWGVRDVFGSGHLLGGGYRAAMTKHREKADRVLPPVAELEGCRFGLRSWHASEPSRGHYELRAGDGLAPCAGLGTSAESTFFANGMMIANRFGTSHVPTQHSSKLNADFGSLDDPERLLPGVSVRFDEGDALLSVATMGFDMGEGWLVPRLGLGRKLSAEMLFTPSATAWTCPYVSTGWEHRTRRPSILGGSNRLDAMVTEVGVKFRFALPEGKSRFTSLGYRFGGMRLGVRFNGLERIEHLRLTAAIGAGVF